MCGFAGELLFHKGPADLDIARSMAGRLVHRGPDEAGGFLSADGRCAIGFRRLSVIDPAGSHQPMSTPDGKLTVAYNGEIYNFQHLRGQLQAEGARLATAGDTEVLLHLYRRHGERMLACLEGMFAFAIYDADAGSLLLARDRMGQKPLWYAVLDDRLLFASEAKALLTHPLCPRRPDYQAVTCYLTMGYVPAPVSAWAGVSKLLPGHALHVDSRPSQPWAYWRAAPLASTPADPPAGLRTLLARTVAEHMVSDVPLGVLLSGGIDSAVVAALAVSATGDGRGVRTFTAGFADSEYDERPAAAEVAGHLGTRHTELLIQPDFKSALDTIVAMYDEPFGDSSALPTWLICRQARQHVTVALVGDGGDEVFAGYDRYRAMLLADRMGPLKYTAVRLAAFLARPLAPTAERSRLRRFVRFADGLIYPPSQQYFVYRRLFAPADLARLLTPEFAAGLDLDMPQQWFCDLYERGDWDDEVTRCQAHDLATYLPDDLLVKTDIASMASSLELRAPLLDRRVVEFGLSLGADQKIAGRRGKLVLRRAFADVLPASVFERPKRGFGVPLAAWLRNELRQTMQETLLDRSLLGRGILDASAVRGLVNDHLSGADDHSHRLWALMVLARWLHAHA